VQVNEALAWPWRPIATLSVAAVIGLCLSRPVLAQSFQPADPERVLRIGTNCGSLAYKAASKPRFDPLDRCLATFFSSLDSLPPTDRFNVATATFSSFPCFGFGTRKERIVQKALEAAQQLGDFELVIWSLYHQGVCYWNDHPAQFQKAMAAFEPFKNALAPFVNPTFMDTPEQLAAQVAMFRDAGRKYVRFLDNARKVDQSRRICGIVRDKCLEDAWTLTQRLKARMFHSRMLQVMVARDSTRRLNELLRTEYRVAQQREILRLGLRAQNADSTVSPEALALESDAVQHELRSRFPAYLEFYARLAPSISELQAALSEDEIYISYLMTDKFALAFRITRTGPPLFTRLDGTSAELDEMVTKINNGIASGAKGRALDEDVERVGARLLNALKIPSSAKIIIEADGSLSSFPFALAVPSASDNQISYVPSAGVFLQSRKAPAGSVSSKSYLGFGRTSFPAPLSQLPGVRQELAESAAVFGARAVFSSADAAESDLYRLSTELARAQIVHFASHTVFIQGEIALLLEEGAGEDGRLTEREILARLRISADLVILSACDTATLNREGDIPGEAFSALTRAFFAAGAKKLLVTQWRVGDDAAKQFMREFLRDYARNGKAAEALQRAQRALRSNSALAAKDWAGWILVGG
jgi:CHAT domain-containing protein